MRKLLYILLGVKILAVAICFFMLISSSILYAVIFASLEILELIPIIAIIFCLDNIESLQDAYNSLFYKVKHMDDDINGTIRKETVEAPSVTHQETARAVWECVKCGTVNKAETTHCANCKAEYSPIINPTDNPSVKKKISRWIKYK